MPKSVTPMRVAFRRPWPGTRRGQKLWLLAIIISFKGLGYLRGSTSESTESALRLLTERLQVPLQACGAVILALCAVAIFCSYCHYGRDRYGYMLLVGFSATWAACFAVSPLLLDGPAYAWQGALSWLLIGLFLLFSAADPEPASHRSAR